MLAYLISREEYDRDNVRRISFVTKAVHCDESRRRMKAEARSAVLGGSFVSQRTRALIRLPGKTIKPIGDGN